jgi:hypothetical protein
MPRRKSSSTAPAASNRFMRPAGDRQDDQQLTLAELTTPEDFWQFVNEVIAVGVSLTIGLTSRGDSMAVVFYDGNERSPWYIQTQDGWDAMLVRLSVERD